MNSNVSLCNFRNGWARINWERSFQGTIGSIPHCHGALFIHNPPQIATEVSLVTLREMGVTRVLDEELTQHQMIQTHAVRRLCFLLHSVYQRERVTTWFYHD